MAIYDKSHNTQRFSSNPKLFSCRSKVWKIPFRKDKRSLLPPALSWTLNRQSFWLVKSWCFLTWSEVLGFQLQSLQQTGSPNHPIIIAKILRRIIFLLPLNFKWLWAWELIDNGQINRRKNGFFLHVHKAVLTRSNSLNNQKWFIYPLNKKGGTLRIYQLDKKGECIEGSIRLLVLMVAEFGFPGVKGQSLSKQKTVSEWGSMAAVISGVLCLSLDDVSFHGCWFFRCFKFKVIFLPFWILLVSSRYDYYEDEIKSFLRLIWAMIYLDVTPKAQEKKVKLDDCIKLTSCFFFLFLKKLHPRTCLLILEREEERERERNIHVKENHQSVSPIYVPWPGIEPTT